MPAKRKPAGEKQRRSSGARSQAAPIVTPGKSLEEIVTGQAADKAQVVVPELPGDMLDETRRLWAAFWEEPHAAAVIGAQLVVALRWAEAFDQWRRSLDKVIAQPFVDGSQGQPVGNPLMAWVASREAEMEKCERQLGIGLRNRSDLGIAAGQAQLTAQELIRMQRESGSAGPDDQADGTPIDDEGWEAVG